MRNNVAVQESVIILNVQRNTEVLELSREAGAPTVNERIVNGWGLLTLINLPRR